MPLHIPQPPSRSLDSLRATLPALAARVGVAKQAPHITQALELATQHPSALKGAAVTPVLSSPVYVLGLDTIAAMKGLSAAQLVAWTHLLPSAGKELVSADLRADNHAFLALTQGPHPTAFAEQVESLQAAPDLGEHAYELAQLRVPALHVNAVWLRDKATSNDLVLPLEPTAPELVAGRRYSAQEFEAALQVRAKAVLAESDPLKGG